METKRLTPLKAIKTYCTDCVCGTRYVHDCGGDGNCTLFPYRKGHNPSRRGIGREGGPTPKIGAETVR